MNVIWKQQQARERQRGPERDFGPSRQVFLKGRQPPVWPVCFCVVHVVVAGAFAWAYSHTAIPGHMFSGLDDSIIT